MGKKLNVVLAVLLLFTVVLIGEEYRLSERGRVIDRLGVDTNLAEIEYKNKRHEFNKLAQYLNIPEGNGGYKFLFEKKVNLQKVNELKEHMMLSKKQDLI